MKHNYLYKILVIVSFFIIIIIIVLNNYKFKTESIFSLDYPKGISGVLIDIPTRRFNVFDDNLKDEINETYHYEYNIWKKTHDNRKELTENMNIFEGWDTVFSIGVPKYINPLTLIYFPSNKGLNWKTNNYFINETTNEMIYPEPNSLILSSSKLIWQGNDETFKILIGNQKTK